MIRDLLESYYFFNLAQSNKKKSLDKNQIH